MLYHREILSSYDIISNLSTLKLIILKENFILMLYVLEMPIN